MLPSNTFFYPPHKVCCQASKGYTNLTPSSQQKSKRVKPQKWKGYFLHYHAKQAQPRNFILLKNINILFLFVNIKVMVGG